MSRSVSFWPKRSSGGTRRTKPAKPDFSKVLAETDAAASQAPPESAAPEPVTLKKREKRSPAKPNEARAATPVRKRLVKLAAPVIAKPKKKFSFIAGTGSIVSVLALLLILGGWGVGMTLVVIFGDKLSARLIAQNSEMQDAYEQRLQAYRDEISRVISESEQNRVDRDSVTGRVIELTRRQRIIETRQNVLNKLADQIGGDPSGASVPALVGVPPVTPPPTPPPRPGFPTRPATPSGQRGGLMLPLVERWAEAPKGIRVATAGSPDGLIRFAQLLEPPVVETGPTQSEIELENQVDKLAVAIEKTEVSVMRALGGMSRLSELRIGRFRSALTTLGMTPEELAPETGRTANNLPGFIVPISEQNTPFGQRINQIRGNVALLYRLRPAISAMPLNRPTNEARFSSGFGYRVHPIAGVSRLHAGLDLAAPVGTPVRAAGSGVVLSAGWGGGYGNLIQVDHGNGVVSRYAHLSAIEVAQGQPVAIGAQIGLMGSTGASTGSHLHFETRIRGAPQNPACFLIAGDKLRDAASPGFTCDKPPFQHKPTTSEDEDDDS